MQLPGMAALNPNAGHGLRFGAIRISWSAHVVSTAVAITELGMAESPQLEKAF